MTPPEIVSATRNSVTIDVAGVRHTVSRRAVAVALDYMDTSCDVSYRLGTRGPRLSRGQWQAMAAASRTASLGGGA